MQIGNINPSLLCDLPPRYPDAKTLQAEVDDGDLTEKTPLKSPLTSSGKISTPVLTWKAGARPFNKNPDG